MSSTTYAQAVNGALDRLQTTGFYLGNTFANHGPMAATTANTARCPNHRSRSTPSLGRIGSQPWEIASAVAIGSSSFVANWPRPLGESCLKAGGPACFPAAPDR